MYRRPTPLCLRVFEFNVYRPIVCVLPLHLGMGESTIVCTEAYTVLGGGVSITNALVVGGEVSCSYTLLLTADDVNNLERTAVVTVTAKDEHDYQVDASATEVVSLSQVTFGRTTETSLFLCAARR